MWCTRQLPWGRRLGTLLAQLANAALRAGGGPWLASPHVGAAPRRTKHTACRSTHSFTCRVVTTVTLLSLDELAPSQAAARCSCGSSGACASARHSWYAAR